MVLTASNSVLILCIGLLGILIGWLIAHLRYQQCNVYYENDIKLLSQQIEQYDRENKVLNHKINEQNQQKQQDQLELREIHARLAAMQENLQQQNISRKEWREEYEKLNQELRMMREVNSAQEAELREVSTRLDETRLGNEEKQRLLINSEQRLQTQFENLAHRIFENSGRKVDEQNQQSLNTLLIPLREQLEVFRKQVQDGFGLEARERHTLSHEIRQLQQLNSQMAQEAVNLTNALKGNNKTQGNWGEMVLARVLEASGLREGYEYHPQTSLKNTQGERQQPDIIVHLPQDKDIIIDAKMSLIAYERYFNSQSEHEREQALAEHVLSVRQHIRQLGKKDYHELPQIRTLDYVLMFIPVEPAFLLAIDCEPELISEALKCNIMLVSPTTLLVALRTISNLWRYEHQSQNAKQIADRAAKLYDKMRLFVDDLLVLGQNLNRAQQSYQQAVNKLSQGRGNMLGQIEGFRELGVDVKKPIAIAALQTAQTSPDLGFDDLTPEINESYQ